jgi:hypothetical protein
MKKRNRKNIIILFVLLISSFLYSQEKENDSYLIITYEVDITNDAHPVKNYYWIVPNNLITADKTINQYPLYFEEFSNDDLNDCINEKEINIFTIQKGENFILEKNAESDIKNLKELLYKNRKKVQTSVKKWKLSGNKETINVFVTPVKGNFCSSNISDYSGNEINYKGSIYLPISNFKLDLDFFKLDKNRLIKNYDYLKVNIKNR